MDTVSRVNDQSCLIALFSIKHSAHFKEMGTTSYYTLQVVMSLLIYHTISLICFLASMVGCIMPSKRCPYPN